MRKESVHKNHNKALLARLSLEEKLVQIKSVKAEFVVNIQKICKSLGYLRDPELYRPKSIFIKMTNSAICLCFCPTTPFDYVCVGKLGNGMGDS